MSRVDPAHNWLAVVPSDTLALNPSPDSLYVTLDGNLALVGSDGNQEIFPVIAGQVLPVRPTKVMSTGTTATAIAIYNAQG